MVNQEQQIIKQNLIQTSNTCTGFNPKLRLLGISTVAANQTVEKVTNNALQFLEAAGLAKVGEHSNILHCL